MRTKLFLSILYLVSIVLLNACNDRHDLDIPYDNCQTMIFHANVPNNDTKTSIQDDYSIFWNKDDSINIFCGMENRGTFVATTKETSEYTDFIGKMQTPVEIDGNNEFWAIYPYKKIGNRYFDDEGKKYISTQIPNIQYAIEDSYDKHSFLSIAKSKSDILFFKNICGGFRFSVESENIKSATFISNGEEIAGKCNIYFDSENPIVKFEDPVQSASQSITLVAPGNEFFKSGHWYYISAAPAILEKGFIIRLYTENDVYEYKHPNKVEIKRSIFGEVSAIDTKAVKLDISTRFSGTASENFYINYDKDGVAEKLYIEINNNGEFDTTLPIANRYYFNKNLYERNQTLLTVNDFPNCASSYSMTFFNCVSLEKVSGIDLSNANELIGTFQGCRNLNSISGNFETIKCIDFSAMFYGCSSLTEIPEINSSSGTKFASMFGNCHNVRKIPHIDLSNGIDFSGMFQNCILITEIPEFNLSQGKFFTNMFVGCNALTTIPNLDVSNGIDFSGMFYGCKSLTEIPLLDMSSGLNFNNTFRDCSSLSALPSLDVSSGESFSQTFSGCSSLVKIPLLNLSKSNNFTGLFSKCSSLTEIPELDFSSGTNFMNLFQHCSSLRNIPDIDVSKGTEFTGMFEGCSALEAIPYLNLSNGTNFSRMFKGCSSITTIPSLDFSSGIRFHNMFSDCTSLINIPDDLDFSSGEKMPGLFSGCTSLVEIPELDFSNCDSFSEFFKNCSSINHIPNLYTSKSDSFYQMFYGCTSIETIPDMDVSKANNFRGMFANCTSLNEIGELTFSSDKNITLIDDIFKNCSSLKNLKGFINLGIDGSVSTSSLNLSETNLSEESLTKFANDIRNGINNPIIIFGNLWSRLTPEAKEKLEGKGYSLTENK